VADIRIEELNGLAQSEPLSMIREASLAYHDRVSALAERVTLGGRIRIVLLSGPSGSGKTTTANLLSDEIRRRGEECMVISLDDFYRNATDPEYPRRPDGERDFEVVGALDIPALVEMLEDIAEARPFEVPKYDFKTGRRTELRSYPAMPNGCVIIEGLHALNPLVFARLPKERVLKIFISVSTNITEGGKRIISGRKLRFLRRMVRDSIYRGADAQKTLELWEGVLHGEDAYLYPTRVHADVSFDTFHTFELSVMSPFAKRLISEELAKSNAYAAAVLEAVRRVHPIDDTLVPDDSLIREFIPGGKYEAVY